MDERVFVFAERDYCVILKSEDAERPAVLIRKPPCVKQAYQPRYRLGTLRPAEGYKDTVTGPEPSLPAYHPKASLASTSYLYYF